MRKVRRPRSGKSFIVRVKSTVIEDYEITAKDEDDARRQVEQGEGMLCNEVERPDWEVETVRPND